MAPEPLTLQRLHRHGEPELLSLGATQTSLELVNTKKVRGFHANCLSNAPAKSISLEIQGLWPWAPLKALTSLPPLEV